MRAKSASHTLQFDDPALQRDHHRVRSVADNLAKMLRMCALTLSSEISQLAYSNLAKSKSNKASSLTNLFRNQGGSFGIAFVTTLLARRSQYHQSVLVAHATPFNERYRQLLDALTVYFTKHGFSHSDAVVHAQAQAFNLIERQATLLAFNDCFAALGCVIFLGFPLVFLIKRFRATAGASESH
jgi:MFS transporter, DHA2 family, multidrug resistance protein